MLATGQRAKALAFLDSLLREGEAPPALVGGMAWMYRKLLEAKEPARTPTAIRPPAVSACVRLPRRWPYAKRKKFRANN
jgi:DNA polymerase III delta subunit